MFTISTSEASRLYHSTTMYSYRIYGESIEQPFQSLQPNDTLYVNTIDLVAAAVNLYRVFNEYERSKNVLRVAFWPQTIGGRT